VSLVYRVDLALSVLTSDEFIQLQDSQKRVH